MAGCAGPCPCGPGPGGAEPGAGTHRSLVPVEQELRALCGQSRCKDAALQPENERFQKLLSVMCSVTLLSDGWVRSWQS